MTTCTPAEATRYNNTPVRTVTTDRIGYDIPFEPANINDLYLATALGAAVAAYINLNIADSPSMHLTAREGEAVAQYVLSLT